MPQLDVSTFPSQIFWLMVCFGILCIALSLFLVPRLAKPIQTRLEILNGYSAEAQALLKQAEDIAAASKEAINTAKHQAAHELHLALNEAQTMRSVRLQTLDNEIQRQLHDLQQNLQKQQQEILDNSKELVTHIILSLYTKLTKQSLSEQQTEALLPREMRL